MLRNEESNILRSIGDKTAQRESTDLWIAPDGFSVELHGLRIVLLLESIVALRRVSHLPSSVLLTLRSTLYQDYDRKYRMVERIISLLLLTLSPCSWPQSRAPD